MAQSTTTLETPGPVRDSVTLRVLRPAGRFVLHFAEMCAAMCAGGIVLSFVFFQGVTLLGYPNFFQQNRELSILILGINWAIAMGVWMVVRGHPWRHNLEMSSTSVVAAVGLIVAYWWVGYVPATRIPGWFGQLIFQCGPSCALMGAYMLFHYKHYTGTAGHHAHQMA